jgi:hypothetical protein
MDRERPARDLRENWARVRRLLWREWDPIGLADVPGAPKDEYDKYAFDIYSLLMDRRAPIAEIEAYLLSIAVDQMALSKTARLTERSAHAAALLVDLRSELERK